MSDSTHELHHYYILIPAFSSHALLFKPLLTRGDCYTCKNQDYFEELHYISSYNVLPVLVFMLYSIELVDGCYAWIVVIFYEIENCSLKLLSHKSLSWWWWLEFSFVSCILYCITLLGSTCFSTPQSMDGIEECDHVRNCDPSRCGTQRVLDSLSLGNVGIILFTLDIDKNLMSVQSHNTKKGSS